MSLEKTLSGKLSSCAFRAFSKFFDISPPWLSYFGADLGADIARAILRNRRRVLEAHMLRISPINSPKFVIDNLVKEGFRSYARYWADVSIVKRLSDGEMLRVFKAHGTQVIFDALKNKRGVLLALAHLGSFEAGGRWLAINGYNMLSVVEELKPLELYDWFVKERRALGINLIPAKETAVSVLIDYLRQGKLVGLVCDRDVTGSGIEVEFFGEKTKMPAGPAVLALRSNCLLVTVAVYSKGSQGWETFINPPIEYDKSNGFRNEVVRITQEIANQFEDFIRRHPEQWHVLQPNWPSDEFLR